MTQKQSTNTLLAEPRPFRLSAARPKPSPSTPASPYPTAPPEDGPALFTFQQAVEQSPTSVVVTDLNGVIRYVNPKFCQITGYSREEAIGATPSVLKTGHTTDAEYAELWRTIRAGGEWHGEFLNKKKNGDLYWEDACITPLRAADGTITQYLGIKEDVTDRKNAERQVRALNETLERRVAERTAQLKATIENLEREIAERKRAEEEVRVSEAKYRLLFENMTTGFALHEMLYDSEGNPIDYRYLEANPAFEHLTGLKVADLIGNTIKQASPDIESHWIETFGKVAQTGEPVAYENYSEALGRHYNVWAFGAGKDRFAVLFSDITERKKAEEERSQLEEQFQQAQKMESVGRLAGGVAHDFNNILTSIFGYLDLAMANVQPAPVYNMLTEARKAAGRAATLTRQLLAFSRKQKIEPTITNLNTVIDEMRGMLHRLIGEDVELHKNLTDPLGKVLCDRGQIEQILVNLCVNARDAMPNGGQIDLETHNVHVDHHAGPDRLHPKSGDFVLLRVRDIGCGMSDEVKQHLFEPFFTTKPVGKGTGLGLASIYGAVQQNEGFIEVESEEGIGTTFDIYFPVAQGAAETQSASAPSKSSTIPMGHETVLLAEDDQSVRTFTETVLKSLGYRVITCSNGAEALEAAEEHKETIHLLLTDVIMPRVGGRALAASLMPQRPGMRVLFISGYTDETMAQHRILDKGVHFLEKPYTAKQLAHKIRETLESVV